MPLYYLPENPSLPLLSLVIIITMAYGHAKKEREMMITMGVMSWLRLKLQAYAPAFIPLSMCDTDYYGNNYVTDMCSLSQSIYLC